jgi:hypothetical protein
MDARARPIAYRSWTALVVIVLHALILGAILVFSRTRLSKPTAATPLEVEFLNRPAPSAPAPPPPSPPHTARMRPETPTRGPTQPSSNTALTPSVAAPPTLSTPGPVDWTREASIVAAIQGSEAAAAAPSTGGTPTVQSPFQPPPAHYAGEEIAAANGDTMVFVSANCYQVVPRIPPIQNGMDNHKPLQVYCMRRSKAARGDLFKDLPAYKKLHPDD